MAAFAAVMMVMLGNIGIVQGNEAVTRPIHLVTYNLYPMSNKAGTAEMDQLVRAVFETAGFRPTIEWLPQTRSLELTRKGMKDGIYARVFDIATKNENLTYIPFPVYRGEYVAISYNPKLTLKTWEDLKNYRAVYPKGWRVFEFNRTVYRYARPVTSSEQIVKLFNDRKIDMVLYEKESFPYLASLTLTEPYADIAPITEYYQVSPILDTKDLYILINRKFESDVPKLTQILENMYSDGRFEALCPICFRTMTAAGL